ncbi:hypothetical protein [Arenimonas composti]|uniref:Uncharacterized protein n=1 Tax=Arenimonas composti TR7-09 = DSM 18010 TaxID=1121013 RepID=A0A091BYT6_9GAMM|nr:hypothetical protein [Arenimonas composti]KFN49515.1 hypothetical protein P873_10195 [Arenimonas composti TR7-09 = DSM 18010]
MDSEPGETGGKFGNDVEPDDSGRVFLASVWLLAGAGLIYVALAGSPALLAMPGLDRRSGALLLAPLILVGIAAIAVSAALFLRWRHARYLVAAVTWPGTVLFAWALVWCVIGLLAAPGSETVVASVVPLLGLLLMARTRRLARALAVAGAPGPAAPVSPDAAPEHVVVLEASSSVEGAPREYRWIAEHLPGGEVTRQALVQRGDRVYDRFDVVLPDGTTHRVFFDITAYSGK